MPVGSWRPSTIMYHSFISELLSGSYWDTLVDSTSTAASGPRAHTTQLSIVTATPNAKLCSHGSVGGAVPPQPHGTGAPSLFRDKKTHIRVCVLSKTLSLHSPDTERPPYCYNHAYKYGVFFPPYPGLKDRVRATRSCADTAFFIPITSRFHPAMTLLVSILPMAKTLIWYVIFPICLS